LWRTTQRASSTWYNIYELDYQLPSEQQNFVWYVIVDERLLISSANVNQLKPGFQVVKVNPSQSTSHENAVTYVREWYNNLDARSQAFLQCPAHTEDLAVHAGIYALADKYDVRGLQELAREKFKHVLQRVFHDDLFFEVVDTVYSRFPDGQEQLKIDVAQQILSKKQLLRHAQASMEPPVAISHEFSDASIHDASKTGLPA